MDHEEQDETVDDGVEASSDGLSAQDTKLMLAQRILAHMKEQVENLERVLSSEPGADFERLVKRERIGDSEVLSGSFEGRVVDGVFDGEHMVGEDGRKYLVPPNYASKSKLVEGDMLRLMINDNGKFVFKQKGPIERQRVVGLLTQDDLSGDWQVMADGQRFRVLTAAVTYHHGSANDDAVILVPKNAPSSWAAVENIIKREE